MGDQRTDVTHDDDDRFGLKAAARALTDASDELTRRAAETALNEANDKIARSLTRASEAMIRATERATRHTAADRRADKAERTRAELLAAAATLIATRGYEGASVGDIAAEAGFTKGALYTHFGSKEALFLVLAKQTLAGAPPLPDDAAADAARLLLLEIWLYGARHPETGDQLAEDWRGWIVRTGEDLCGRVPEGTSLTVEQLCLSGAAVALMVPLGGVLGLDDAPGASALAALAALQAAVPPAGS